LAAPGRLFDAFFLTRVVVLFAMIARNQRFRPLFFRYYGRSERTGPNFPVPPKINSALDPFERFY